MSGLLRKPLSVYSIFESEQGWLKVDTEETRENSLNSSQVWNCVAEETIIRNTAFLSISISLFLTMDK